MSKNAKLDALQKAYFGVLLIRDNFHDPVKIFLSMIRRVQKGMSKVTIVTIFNLNHPKKARRMIDLTGMQ